MSLKLVAQAVLIGAAGYLLYEHFTLGANEVTGNTLQDMADKAADKYGIPRGLFRAQITAESNWNPKAKGPTITAGALAGQFAAGLLQLMPGTALMLGVIDRYDPAQSLAGGAKYLSQQLKTFGGDIAKALAAYNAGPGTVKKAIAYAKAHGGTWQERMRVYQNLSNYNQTKNYVAKIMGTM